MLPPLREILKLPPGSQVDCLSAATVPVLRAHGISWLSYERLAAGHRRERPPASTWKLGAMVHGQAEAYVDGRWLPAPEGSLYLVAPGWNRGLRSVKPIEIAWFDWDGGGRRRAHPAPAVIADLYQCRLLGDIARIACADWHRVGSEAAHPAWLLVVRSLLDRMLDRSEDGRLGERFDDAWHRVRLDVARDWSLADIAHLAGTGVETLRRDCLRRHRTSPMRHLRRLRLEQACGLLAHSGLGVAETGRRIGFTAPAAFINAFRANYACTPGAWRKRLS